MRKIKLRPERRMVQTQWRKISRKLSRKEAEYSALPLILCEEIDPRNWRKWSLTIVTGIDEKKLTDRGRHIDLAYS